MKKKNAKLMRALAARLPDTKRLSLRAKYTKGYDLTAEEREKLTIPYNPKTMYKRNVHYLLPVNHYRILKKAWEKDKERGLMLHIKWVDDNNKRLNKMFKDHKMERVDDGLMKLTMGKPSGFWGNLAKFLMAFFASFVKPTAKE